MYTEDFELFWKKYPKKVAKYKAFLSFRRLNKNEKVALNNGLEEYIKKWTMENKPYEYIPYPSTFINQQRFYDEIIIDIEGSKKINEIYKQKKEEKKEEINIIEEQKKLKSKYIEIPEIIKQKWRFNIKIEIITQFPGIWEKEKMARFYYTGRINFYIKNYINQNVNT